MRDKFLILFLQIITGNGNIDTLLKEGLEYAQIASLITNAFSEGFIDKCSEGLFITDIGKQKLNELNSKYGKMNSGKWINHLEYFKIDKIGLFEIYLPDKKSIKFRAQIDPLDSM